MASSSVELSVAVIAPNVGNNDEVFTNGDLENAKNSVSLSEDIVLSEQKLPRRSSLIKDGSRRASERKKTVSFSSLPGEKTIVTGMFFYERSWHVQLYQILIYPVVCINVS